MKIECNISLQGRNITILLDVGKATRITSKSNVGSYSYSSAHHHAVSRVNGASKNLSTEAQKVTYTSFNKVNTISQDYDSLIITYGPNHQRVKTVLSLVRRSMLLRRSKQQGSSLVETKSKMNKDGNIIFLYYILCSITKVKIRTSKHTYISFLVYV